MVGLGQPSLAPSQDDSLHAWWSSVTMRWPKPLASKIRAILLLVFRAIWLERNAMVFRAKSRPVALVLDAIMVEAERWNLVGLF
jgi:hypothetical protein